MDPDDDPHTCEDFPDDPCAECASEERQRDGEHYARMNAAWARAMMPILFPGEKIDDD